MNDDHVLMFPFSLEMISRRKRKKEKNKFCEFNRRSVGFYVGSQRPKTKTGGRELNLTPKVIF